jgi:hypothetical protein
MDADIHVCVQKPAKKQRWRRRQTLFINQLP